MESKKVIINLHHLGDQIRTMLGTGKDFGFDFEYSVEKTILGTGGGIKKAQKFLRNGSFLVMNADIIVDLNLKRLISAHQKIRPYATLVVAPGPQAKKLGVLYVNRQKQIVSILDKPSNTNNLTETFFTGIHVLSSRFFKIQKSRSKACIIRDNYIPQLRAGTKLGAFMHTSYWNDLGTKNRLRETTHLLKSGKLPLTYSNHLKFFKNILDQKMPKGR